MNSSVSSILYGIIDRPVVSFTALLILYSAGLALYRVFFSQLASFPGPRLAAATFWYEFYYDFCREGKYIFEIERLHQQYGPIVRINPEEISINDPEASKEIYVSESKRRTEGHSAFAKGINLDGAHLLTTDHDLHRRRRKPLEPLFSRLGVSRLQLMLAEVVEKLASRIEAFRGTHSVIRLDHAFSAFSGDIIGRICWEDKKEFLDDPAFAPEWSDSDQGTLAGLSMLKRNQVAKDHITKAKQAKLDHDLKGTPMDSKSSLFRYIMNSDMPESERSDERLAKEAQVLLAGGTASTARTLTFISYYILSRPEVHSRLKQELRDTMATYPENIPSWADLERLSYLQALIKEGLRYPLSHWLIEIN
ncbi:MAG: hypothetical protein Q9225_002860 [Loekoesia sp. 1 TL-2023]